MWMLEPKESQMNNAGLNRPDYDDPGQSPDPPAGATPTWVDPERKLMEELVGRMAAGDQGALADFYDRFSPTLYGLAVRILQDEMESEDVLQDAFIYIWKKAVTYKPQLSSPFSWSVMIVRNKAIDRLRKRQRVEKIAERVAAEFFLGADFDAESAEEPCFREQRGIVRSALTRLPAEQRQALNLAFFGGLTHEEIAKHLDTPAGTIKSRIRRGLIGLHDLVEAAR
jgi:RNA polymerase sigma-70 factor (ECF subfamily)